MKKVKIGKKIATVSKANGAKGCLLFTGSEVIFRVYSRPGEFMDYELSHSDLQVTIKDTDAYFYTHEDGRSYLDHAPRTLGLKEVK